MPSGVSKGENNGVVPERAEEGEPLLVTGNRKYLLLSLLLAVVMVGLWMLGLPTSPVIVASRSGRRVGKPTRGGSGCVAIRGRCLSELKRESGRIVVDDFTAAAVVAVSLSRCPNVSLCDDNCVWSDSI